MSITINRAEDKSVDSIVPGDKWVFDDNVAKCFSDMLSKSIPAYEQMRTLTFNLGKNFLRSSRHVIDLGASRGDAIAPFVEYSQETYKNPEDRPIFNALEIAEPMRKVMEDRFGSSVEVKNYDLRKINMEYTPFLPERSCVILSILTLQFVPIEYRLKVINTIYKSLCQGGAFLFVEKILGSSAELDDLFVDEYYKIKAANGYSYEDIQRKRASLEGVLVPMTHDWNVQMLRQVGFTNIDCYYRNLNFEGLICIKD